MDHARLKFEPKLGFLFYVLYNIVHRALGAAPTGCALDDTVSLIGRYECDFNAVSFPLVMTDFTSPDPQRLLIYNVSGTLPSPSFSGFNSFNTGTLDTDYPASLEIQCGNGGTLTFSAGTFGGMSYLQEFYISFCVISDLPDNAFSDFGTLNYFQIEGGSIAQTRTNSLTGLSVTRVSTPTPLGTFAIIDSPIGTGVLADGFLNPLTTVSTIVLENTGLSSIAVNTFSKNTIVRDISITGNRFQTLPKNIFAGLDALMFLDISDIPFNCTCTELWYLDYLADNDVKITGAAECNLPSSYASKRATKFYHDNCPYDPCGSIPGLNADPFCYTIFQLFGYVVICGSFVMAWTGIILFMNVRLHIAIPKLRLEMKKKRAWVKVKDSLYKGMVNLIPPASTGIEDTRNLPILRGFHKRFRSNNDVHPFDPPSYSDLMKEDIAIIAKNKHNSKEDTDTEIDQKGSNQTEVAVQVHASAPDQGSSRAEAVASASSIVPCDINRDMIGQNVETDNK